MKKLNLRKFLVFSVFAWGLSSSLMAMPKDSILLVYTKEEFLEWFNNNRALRDEDVIWSIILGDNIDLEGASLLPFENFKGSFEGGCFTLSNFQITADGGGAGMFEDLDGSIRNLTLQNVRINSQGNNVGALTGTVLFESIISNCMVIDSKVQGKDLVGILAGVNLGKIENCIVVNDTLVSISQDPLVYLGGIVGKNCLNRMVRNCVVMIDLFCLQTLPAKDGNVGRVAGGEGLLRRNYGWGEVGFALWSEKSNSYYYRYYPNWTAKESYVGTGGCKVTGKHGENIFVGDYDPRVYPISSDFKFWAFTSEFNFNFWQFPEKSKYPRLKNSKIDTEALIARRGFESDQVIYSEADPVDKIGTALMFAKVAREKNMYGKDTLLLGTDILMISSDLHENTLWGIDLNGEKKGNIDNCFVEFNYCPFDGKGHEISGARVNKSSGTIGIIGKAKNSIVRTAVSEFNGGYFSDSLIVTFSAGTLAGEVQSKQAQVENCLIDGTFISLSSANTLDIGGLIGCSISSDRVANNIVRGLFLKGISISSNFANVGGILGSMNVDCVPVVQSNFVDALTKNDAISAYSFDYPRGGKAGRIVGNIETISKERFAECYYRWDSMATFTTQDSLGYHGSESTSSPELWQEMGYSATYWEGLDTDQPYLKKEELIWEF